MKKIELEELIEKYTKKAPVEMEGEPDAHNVWLVVNQQSFRVTPEGVETEKAADHRRLMLAKALKKMIENYCKE